jgi:hypothetical protein
LGLKSIFLPKESEELVFKECFVMVPISASHLAKAQSTNEIKSLGANRYPHNSSFLLWNQVWVPVDPMQGKAGQKVFKKNKCSMKNPWQRWKSYFPGQDFAKFGKNSNKIIYLFIYLFIYFNNLIFFIFLFFFSTH